MKLLRILRFMTPSQHIKERGLKSLAFVSEEADVSQRTLINWYHHSFRRFEEIVNGVLYEKEREE